MSVITVNCPKCKKPYRVYNSPTTRFECSDCKHQLAIPNNSGNEMYVIGIITPYNNTSSVNPLVKQSYWPVIIQLVFIGLVFICVVAYIIDFIKSKSSKPITTVNNYSHMVATPYQAITVPSQIQSTPSQSIDQNTDYDLVYVRITNSLMGTDKQQRCKSYLSEKDSTYTLLSVDHPKESFKMISRGGGVCDFQFYLDNALEASKVVYRRSDLETEGNGLIYTSRTGEITITISYNQ